MITGTEVVERIKDMCTVKELESIGIAASTVSNWSTRGTVPKADDLYKISKYLNVSMEFLLTGQDKAGNDKDVYQLIQNYKKLDARGKRDLLEIAECLVPIHEETTLRPFA